MPHVLSELVLLLINISNVCGERWLGFTYPRRKARETMGIGLIVRKSYESRPWSSVVCKSLALSIFFLGGEGGFNVKIMNKWVGSNQDGDAGVLLSWKWNGFHLITLLVISKCDWFSRFLSQFLFTIYDAILKIRGDLNISEVNFMWSIWK